MLFVKCNQPTRQFGKHQGWAGFALETASNLKTVLAYGTGLACEIICLAQAKVALPLRFLPLFGLCVSLQVGGFSTVVDALGSEPVVLREGLGDPALIVG